MFLKYVPNFSCIFIKKSFVSILHSVLLIRLTAFVSGIISLMLNLLSSRPVSGSYGLNSVDWTNMKCLVSERSGIDDTACT
jgi:hypothetical protein